MYSSRSRLVGFIALVGVLLAIAGCAVADVIVAYGVAKGCIVVPDGTEKGRVLTAAKDLQGYIQQMSGVVLPIRWDSGNCPGFRILIGSTSIAPVKPTELTDAKLGFDGFIVRSVPKGVVIAGRTPQGTGNGVYHFAENVLEVHWFSLDDNAPTCPQRGRIDIPKLNLTIKPEFAWRGQYYSGMRNYLTQQQKDNQGKWWTFNRIWGLDGFEVYHALADIVHNNLYDAHPEYFPLVNGKRLRGDTNPDSSEVQRCLSNPDVIKMAAAFSAKQFDANPGLRFTSLSANDAGSKQGGFCECDNCKALGPTVSDQVLAFANAVSKINAARYPGKGYGFNAYRHTLNPPQKVKAQGKMLPDIAPLDNCLVHSIYSDCPWVASVKRSVKGWKQTAGRISFYLYNYGGPFTGPDVLTMAEELRFMRDNGAVGGFREYNGAPQANWAMQNWIETKLLWDVDQDVLALRKQFIKGYYGPTAAAAVERVYDFFQNTLRNTPTDQWNDERVNHQRQITSITITRIAAKCRADIDAALAVAKQESNPAFRRRIARDMECLLGELPDDLKGLVND